MILSVLLLLEDSNHYHVTSNMEGNLEGSILEKIQKQIPKRAAATIVDDDDAG